LAIFPGYSANSPVVAATIPGVGTDPSAVDIDPTLGVLVVAETGSNGVQFYSIGVGSLTPLGGPVHVGATATSVPTGLSVNRTNHTVAVVNYQEQSVTVLPIPGGSSQAPFTIDISNALQGQASPAPLPYSIGVDPDTNMAVVAYSSTAASSAANLGFLVNLNTGANAFGCPLKISPPQNGAPNGECLYAQVTLNTGQYPQVAMAPHGHLAFVTPGGSGVLQGVDVTKASASAFIKSLTLAAGIVTVTTVASNGLVPGDSGTVLIAGVPGPGTSGNSTTANFNGVFNVAAVSDTSFTYIINSTSSGTATPPPDPNDAAKTTAQVFFSSPNLIFGGLSQFTQGIAINPITNTAALADANATNFSQINLINNLDQSISSISFSAGCTFYTVTLPCGGSPELVGTADVAWQPYSNAIVSYNPRLNQVSVSDPVSARRYAFVCEANATKQNAAPPCLVDPPDAAHETIFNNQTTLTGTGKATLTVTNGTTNSLTLFGGLAVDPATNQAFVIMSGSNQIDIINLGPSPTNQLKAVQISEILVPSPNPGLGVIGGIPNATVPQGTLTSATDLVGVQIFGSGFDASTQVRLDGTAIPVGNVQFVNSRQLTATIPAANLSFPHRFALDAVNGSGVQSNATDFFVLQAVDLSKVCTSTAGTQPSSVAIADQLVNRPFSPIAVVTNSGCNNISVVDINPTATVNGQTVQNPNFGKILNTIAVGAVPQGIAVSQPFGLAVVANNSAGTASIVNLLTNSLAVPDVATGTNPSGVAINDATGAAIVANTGSNTISEINLGLLFGTTPATTLTPVSISVQQPTAVAIDPDRGTNNQGIAVVTSLSLQSNAGPQGLLQVVDIGLSTPTLSTTALTGNVTAPTTGIVFDPTVATGSANPGVFYASSSGGNVISSFNPDNGQVTTVNVGINPTALAINPETGAILTTNLAGKTTSLVDTTSSPLKTVKTIGLPGSGQFGVAIDQFTNLAVIVDQANNRLLIFAMPN
jgi:DNA-binding beta-propeller fold protein YncE